MPKYYYIDRKGPNDTPWICSTENERNDWLVQTTEKIVSEWRVKNFDPSFLQNQLRAMDLK